MAYVPSLLLTLGLLLPVSGPIVGERVLWAPEHTLAWDHFRGVPETNSRYVALTKIDMSIVLGPLQQPGAIELIISTELMTDGSWVKLENRTAHILGHEQGHFDIAEYHARRLRKELLDTAPLNGSHFSEEVDMVFERIFTEKQEMQQAYDRETDHSMKIHEQLDWDERIAGLLDSLSAYSTRSVVITYR